MTRGPVAVLPQYDWPEVRPATDRLWGALRDALRGAGVAAPETLDRSVGCAADAGADLCLGQVCGLPFLDLKGRLRLIGSVDYAVPGAPGGWYRSAVVARADDRRGSLAAFRGATLAVNERRSQSGWGAMLHHAAPLSEGGRFFGAARITGSHRASVVAVADGTADLAAIDFVSWRLAERFLPESRRLRVILLTDPTPGQAIVTAVPAAMTTLRRALSTGIERLDAASRTTLGIAGFQPLEPAAYAVIGARLAVALERLVDDPAVTAPSGIGRA